MSPDESKSQTDNEDWQQLVDLYAPMVWRVINSAQVRGPSAIAVSRLTWMRLADHVDELRPDQIEWWLSQTARRESARSTRLLEIPSSIESSS